MVACLHQQQLKNIYKQITDTNKDIDRALELLEGQGAPKATRIRRAWFSGVGKVSRYVFGTLDEQTGVRPSTKPNGGRIQEIRSDTNEDRGARTKNTDPGSASTRFPKGSCTDSSDATYRRKCTTVRNWRTNSDWCNSICLARVHSPTVSKSYADPRVSGFDIQNNIGSSFPSLNRRECHIGVSQDTDVTILLYNFRLVYHIALPLIAFNTYQLFNASLLPVLQRTVNKSNNFAYIWPSSQYFAVSISKNTYINMDSKALGNCKKLNKSYICRETEPDQILNKRAGCEVKLAANIPIQNFSQCEIKTAANSLARSFLKLNLLIPSINF